MNKSRLLALSIAAFTVVVILIGTIWPSETALNFTGKNNVPGASNTPQAAVTNLARQLGRRDYQAAWSSLSNKGEFTVPDLTRDLSGETLSLRTYATLDNYEVRPRHSSGSEAEVLLLLHWSSVVGPFTDSRVLRVVKNGDRWQVVWPLVKEPRLPPQVIPVNYLRWNVIYRGSADDWGAQDVEAPHIKIVDMHPIERSDGVVVMGELLNEDVVPAYVSVKATLLNKSGGILDSEGSFDRISHTLLPKQVTPFLIRFPGISLSDVGSVRMDPLSTLIPASADPVIGIEDQKLSPAPDARLTGQLVNQSGEAVNIAHVLATFYDKNGQLVWVADRYVDRALQPQTPVPFEIPIPQDLAGKISTQRTIATSFSAGGFR